MLLLLAVVAASRGAGTLLRERLGCNSQLHAGGPGFIRARTLA
jgi:hypothetical protein